MSKIDANNDVPSQQRSQLELLHVRWAVILESYDDDIYPAFWPEFDEVDALQIYLELKIETASL